MFFRLLVVVDAAGGSGQTQTTHRDRACCMLRHEESRTNRHRSFLTRIEIYNDDSKRKKFTDKLVWRSFFRSKQNATAATSNIILVMPLQLAKEDCQSVLSDACSAQGMARTESQFTCSTHETRPMERILSSGTSRLESIVDLEEPKYDEDEISRYAEYPLVQDMLKYEKVRNACFHCDGFDHFVYPQGDGGWIKTLCTLRGRALHNIAIPWLIVTIHSIVVVLVFELTHIDPGDVERAVGDWVSFYGMVLNVILSFLLVFRLNRAAARYWEARKFWGVLIAVGRTLVSGILNHRGHNPIVRDEAIRWTAATAVCVMVFMRGERTLPEHILSGILEKDDIKLVENVMHMPIYAADRIRHALQRLFLVTATTPPSLAHAWTVQRDRLEQDLNSYMTQFGAMERIRSTPLPIVYVAHLRTFLLIQLMLFPYVFGATQHWATIPLTMITAFAFLGIEGASMEVENPFKKGHVNNLNMDGLANALLQNIQQQVQCKADLEMHRQSMTTYI